MWKKIIIMSLIVLITLILYLVWNILASNDINTNDITISTPDNVNNSADSNTVTPKNLPLTLDVPADKKSSYHVTPEDCKNECSSFIKTSDGWRYCANICGIIPVEKPSGECTPEPGLPRDYCLRDKAIDAQDASLCEDISDSGIAKLCRNRIAEDIIDAAF